MDPWTIGFLVAGLLLIGSELVVPSLIGVFFGVAALLVVGMRGLGLVESVPLSLLWFSIFSVGLVVPFRPLVKKLVPGKSDARRDSTDIENDRDSMGTVVEVQQDISEDNDDGRIRFQGTSWQARSTNGVIKAGQKAQLVYKAESIWVVEPHVAEEDLEALRLQTFGAEAAGAVATSATEQDELQHETVKQNERKT
jgi:inner membrane protein